jgi:hypothetical protein
LTYDVIYISEGEDAPLEISQIKELFCMPNLDEVIPKTSETTGFF